MDRRHAVMAVAVVIALIVWATWPSPHRHTPAPVSTRAEGPRRTPASRPAPAAADVAFAGTRAPVAQWVVDENRKSGTREWMITSTGRAADIEGYADRVSAQRGDTVQLMVSTTAPTFHVDAYRMGFYGGLGARLVWRSAEVAGVRQRAPVVEPAVNMVEAGWTTSTRVTVGVDWPPGAYLLKLVGSTGRQRYVPLTVRDDTSRAAYVVQSAVTTWQAYNVWGNFSLYLGGPTAHPSRAERSRIVSFDRPYDHDGSADFVGNELPLISLVESKGLDVTYSTDVDLHHSPQLLLKHRALLTLGH